ncbi:SPEG neighbor protein-like [Eupeodes corollae]|uniref:SPEG neighbor protein-like n=1 Tax=Eupeodes corollae TaxID=290404 RepID=UPI00248FBB88|nr:SPEG neighbor protein-like [Eupeodes corollae]
MCSSIKYSIVVWTFLYISIDGNQFELYSYDDIFTTPVFTNNERHSKISGFFDLRFSHNITTIAGQAAFLNCRVRNIGRKTVSWVRHSDINLLTVGKYTYSSDERFVPLQNDETGDWTLQIKYAVPKDSGAYECQVSTTPPIGLVIFLSVVEPKTTIIGGPDIYINTGSTVNLTCIILQSPFPPQQIQWMHNNKKINYDSPRGGVSVITEKGETTTSYLLVQRAKPGDSGKYSCIPSNANTYSVNVHILNGENPAAMQHTSDKGSIGMLSLSKTATILTMFLTIYVLQM